MNKIVRVNFYDHASSIGMSIKDFIEYPELVIIAYGEVVNETDQFLDICTVKDSHEDEADGLAGCRSQCMRIFKPAIIKLTELNEGEGKS